MEALSSPDRLRSGARFRPDPGRGPDLARNGEIRGPGRGRNLAVFGVRNRGFPGSQIRGKSTLSATMVSVVSTSTDPDFGHFLEILRKSGVPARNFGAPGTPGIGRFRGPGDPGFRAQIWPFSGSGARFRDFGVRGQISDLQYLDIEDPESGPGPSISGFRYPRA